MFCQRGLIAAAILVASVASVRADGVPPSRADAILQMQFNSGVTQKPPPPISGAEASRIYRAYLGRIGRAAPSAVAATMPSAPAPL
jgi:hypothetical protein